MLTADELVTARRLREMVTTEFLNALKQVDVIVTPTTAYPAHPIAGQPAESITHSLTRPISLTGLPSLALPCGFASGGLPVSMQLTGRAWEEGTVLRLGHAYEQATNWSKVRAPLNADTNPPEHVPEPALPSAIDANWVLDYARLTGLSYVTADDAEVLAQSIGPQKTQLHRAREAIDMNVEPDVRPVRFHS